MIGAASRCGIARQETISPLGPKGVDRERHRHDQSPACGLPQLRGQPIFNLHRWRLRERLSFRDALHRANPASGCSREKETGRHQIGPLIHINLLKTEPASRPC